MRTRRPSLSPLVRQFIFERDENQCVYCGATELEAVLQVDHVLPIMQGGTDDPANLVAACVWCNMRKGELTLDQWDAFEQSRGAASLTARLLQRAKRRIAKRKSIQTRREPPPLAKKYTGSFRRRGLLDRQGEGP